MSTAHSTWREHPFEIERSYKAKKTFDGFASSSFVAGQTYIFVDVGWSHYNSCTIFVFNKVGSSNQLFWWLPDDDSITECLEHFEIELPPVICNGIVSKATVPAATSAQKAELDHRLADHLSNSDDVISWSDIKAKALSNALPSFVIPAKAGIHLGTCGFPPSRE
jgi:hypothetical protein